MVKKMLQLHMDNKDQLEDMDLDQLEDVDMELLVVVVFKELLADVAFKAL